MPYGEFPAKIVIAPQHDLRAKMTVEVKSWDEVIRLQRARYEILEWE
jgi:hypothetical protein